jgi:hypothetical protein
MPSYYLGGFGCRASGGPCWGQNNISLRLVKAQHGKLICLLTRGAPTRKTSHQLKQHADFVKPIRTWMLRSSQLPNPIPGTTIHKPAG